MIKLVVKRRTRRKKKRQREQNHGDSKWLGEASLTIMEVVDLSCVVKIQNALKTALTAAVLLKLSVTITVASSYTEDVLAS